MSEEKPTFRVRDRRLFNPDGTPRDVAREEEKPDAQTNDTLGEANSSAASAQAATSGAATTSSAAHQQRGEASAARAPEASQRAHAERGREGQGARADAEQGGAQERRASPQPGAEADPTAFANLVMFIASPAAAALGLSEHPDMQPGEVDLPLARHCIDLLLTLRDKARGNLSEREQQIVEGILAELQMQYVSLNTPRRPAPPRGFTGGDITGGR